MIQRALIISHADADGHLIAEQTRRNLSLLPAIHLTTLIHPTLTKDHKVWKNLEQIAEIDDVDTVFFVDLMFSPASFSAEAQALVDFVGARRAKRFFLIDHHPLPLRRLQRAGNLRVLYRPDVAECTLGPRSGMMVVAALCEGQNAAVANIKRPQHDILAKGVHRAAALGGPLPGRKLLALLRFNCWAGLAQLGLDAPEHHRLPRGRRPLNQPQSSALAALDEEAERLIAGTNSGAYSSILQQRGEKAMAYDVDALQEFDIGKERVSYQAGQRIGLSNYRPHSQDLETIVTLLEVAALSLTTEPDATFSFDQLVREARDVCGNEVKIEERDAKIVLEKASFLRKVGSQFCLK